VNVVVNGRAYERDVPAATLLLELLREELGLTGAKLGCQDGMCGHCSLRVDGRVVKSCLMLAVEADGCEVTTIEGLARGGQLHPLQAAFVRRFAVQCGFCAPGMIMTALELLERTPDPTREQVRAGLDGNICRCTGYAAIVDAVLDAAAELRR
jgi:carbon-monoxide dehydrogenase small subunit